MKKLFTFLITFTGVFLLAFGVLVLRIYAEGRSDRAAQADAIVVLGAAQYAGRPSPVLQARLDHAFELYQTGLAPLIITTGGKQSGERYSEGMAGKMYLEKKGVPGEALIAEENSLTTKQNISRVADIASEKNITSIIIVSDPFHMLRSRMLAESHALTVLPSPTQKSPIAENAWLTLRYVVREAFLVIAHVFFDA